MLPPLNCPPAQTALWSSMPRYPIISWYLGYLKCKLSKMECTPPPSVSPKLGERGHRAAPGCGATLEPPRHPPQRPHSVSKCCGSCFQKPNPLSSSHPHSRHPVRTTSPSRPAAAQPPPAARASPPPTCVSAVYVHSVTTTPAPPALHATHPGTPCSRQRGLTAFLLLTVSASTALPQEDPPGASDEARDL